MFDGVHLGHRAILDALATHAAASGREALAFTFAVHPRETITGEPVRLINTPEQKLELIAPFARAVLLDFSKADFTLTANEFLTRLQADYGVEALVMGYNNSIGSDRRDAAWLRMHSPIEIIEVERFGESTETPSSSAIRRFIEQGDVESARALLGHDLTVRGRVGTGRQIGRKLGFPTANIEPTEARQMLPADGVYAVDVHVGGEVKRGMANIGTRPTLSDGRGRTFEVNIFDYEGDLYGQALGITFLRFLRPEMTLPSLEALEARLLLDKAQARLV